jgi:hypothetical protein
VADAARQADARWRLPAAERGFGSNKCLVRLMRG